VAKARDVPRAADQREPAPEGLSDVPDPVLSGQARLRWASTTSPKHTPDRKAEMPRQVVSLIEASFQEAQWMQGDRHDGIRPAQDFRALCLDQ
jgi:hypothetical protein